MSTKVVNNYNKEADSSQGLYPAFPATNAGVGSQFILYTAAVVSQLKVKINKNVWGTAPSGTITARLYGSHTNTFRDMGDYAEGLINESTNSIDVDDLFASPSEVTFEFNYVELAAGIYFICLFSSNLVLNDGNVNIITTYQSASPIGYITYWWEDQSRWGSYTEWD